MMANSSHTRLLAALALTAFALVGCGGDQQERENFHLELKV